MPHIAGIHSGFYFHKVNSLLSEHARPTFQDFEVCTLRIDFQVTYVADFASAAEFVKCHYVHWFSRQAFFIRWRMLRLAQ
jgi:hypothetical protein